MKLFKRILLFLIILFSLGVNKSILAEEVDNGFKICTYQHSVTKEYVSVFVTAGNGIFTSYSGDIFGLKDNNVYTTEYNTKLDLDTDFDCSCPEKLVLADMSDYETRYCERLGNTRGGTCASYKTGALPKEAYLINEYSDLNSSQANFANIKTYCEEYIGEKAGYECVRQADGIYGYSIVADSVCERDLTVEEIKDLATKYSEQVEEDCASNSSSTECKLSKLRFEAFKDYVIKGQSDEYLKIIIENFEKENPYIDEVTISYGCGLIQGRTAEIMSDALFIIRIVGPLIAIFLGAWDFVRAVVSSKDDALKKAGKRFMNRVFAAALLFLIPLIIELLLTGIDFSGATDSIFCGLE